jgi:hypothetical protein
MKLYFHFLLVVSLYGGSSAQSHQRQLSVCESDADCAEMDYCAAGQCVIKGECRLDVDCVNPLNDQVGLCKGGYFICNPNQQQCECIADQPCPNGRSQVQCIVAPCDTATCGDEAASCVDNYCGGCHAIQFNKAGHQVCNLEDTDVLRSTCDTDQDCLAAQITRQALVDQYCAQGVCLGFRSCTTDLDCRNPANSFSAVGCLGYFECQMGRCGVICTDGPCPDGIDSVMCSVAPCQVDKCSDGVHCVNDYCGECNAIHFDAAGNQACNDDKDTNNTAAQGDTCQTDADCESTAVERALDDQYCTQGVCMEQGTCAMDLDCINPSNQYAQPECLGYLECDFGLCSKICGSPCDDGRGFTDCVVEPCAVESCDRGVSCVNDFCGGCASIFFDAAGKQACIRSCQTNADCDDGRYCASGECLDFGGCFKDLDCINPNNEMVEADCVGYQECTEDGQCTKICDADAPCCFSETCLNETIAKCGEAVVCIQDHCDNCGSILFDATGKQVCDELGIYLKPGGAHKIRIWGMALTMMLPLVYWA